MLVRIYALDFSRPAVTVYNAIVYEHFAISKPDATIYKQA